MENRVLTQLDERKSVRAFENKAISEDVKTAILQAAFAAPTAGCMMLYTILDVTEQPLKENLATLCDHQPFIASAPLVLLFIADYQKWYNLFCSQIEDVDPPGAGELYIAFSDALIAAQNTVVAAHSLGLGSCYIGDIIENYEQVKALLSLPEYAFPAAMVVYGYPTKQQQGREKPERFDPAYMVCQNTYNRLSAEELARYHTERNSADKDLAAFTKAFYKRKYDSDFAKEMRRSAKKYFDAFLNHPQE